MTNLVSWITKTIMDVSIPKKLAKKQRHQRQLKLGQTSKLTKFDERFQAVPPITDLKVFYHYSKVVQWTGNEKKAMVK